MSYATDEQKTAMDALRAAVKASPWTYYDVGWKAGGKSSDWVGEVLRGNYPHYHGYLLPKNIADALERLGFDVPKALRSF